MTRTDSPGLDGPWDERTLLLTMLRYTQETAVEKARGLSDDDARRALLPTSPDTTIAGLLNHLRWVEHSWVHTDLLGGPDDAPWSDEHPDAEFDEGVALPLAEVVRLYQEESARTLATFEQHDLDAPMLGTLHQEPLTARWILLHLIEETARHNGHIDILREMIDGTVGD